MIESRYRHGKINQEYHTVCDKLCTIFGRYDFASSQGISRECSFAVDRLAAKLTLPECHLIANLLSGDTPF